MADPVIGQKLFRAAILAALLPALAACSTAKHLAKCPSAGILADASHMVVFRVNAPHDPSGELYTVDVDSVKTDCKLNEDAQTATSSLDINFHANRTPDGQPAQYLVPYFVAVTGPDGRILHKERFTVMASFEANQASAAFTDHIGAAIIKPDRGKTPPDYQLLTGLQLTQDQLDYNRKIGRYVP
ncbi:MAG TPA: hypothetical protein VK779_03600 [Rhizomicrobium sp.]|jgi:hypothetical protein|nr:hypothetical protein [Rhizomicrobium sp.]